MCRLDPVLEVLRRLNENIKGLRHWFCAEVKKNLPGSATHEI